MNFLTGLNPWLLLSGALALAGLTGGAYLKGHSNGVDSERVVWQDKQVKATQHVAVVQTKQAAVTAAVDQTHQTAVEHIKTVYRTITKEVPHNVYVKMDSGCTIPNDFVWMWNNASGAMSGLPVAASIFDASPSTVKLSDVSQQHNVDAEQYYETVQQLTDLQDWVKGQAGIH